VFYKTHKTFSFSWNGFPHVGLKPQGLFCILPQVTAKTLPTQVT